MVQKTSGAHIQALLSAKTFSCCGNKRSRRVSLLIFSQENVIKFTFSFHTISHMTRRRRRKKKKPEGVAKYYICTESKADGGEYTNTQGKKQPLTVRYYYPSDEKTLAYVDSGSTTTTTSIVYKKEKKKDSLVERLPYFIIFFYMRLPAFIISSSHFGRTPQAGLPVYFFCSFIDVKLIFHSVNNDDVAFPPFIFFFFLAPFSLSIFTANTSVCLLFWIHHVSPAGRTQPRPASNVALSRALTIPRVVI